MRFESVKAPDKRLSPLVQGKSSCACPDGSAEKSKTGTGPVSKPYITGYVKTASGNIPQTSTVLTGLDRWETVKARMSSFRMSYTVSPGLYAAGNPDDKSDVFVTANYKMSFDALRSAINGMNAWVLVLDTAGINVWCAAGKGTFGTDELLKRITGTGLSAVVSHRKIILPQLGAPGIDSGEVRRRSGFTVLYGPVRAADVGRYVRNGYRCDEDMRRVRFTILDRLILTPIEMRQILVKLPYFALFVFVFFGLSPEGIIFRDSLTKGFFYFTAGLLAVFSGAFFSPVFLPFIPFRSFALKGWAAGMVIFTPVLYFTGAIESYNVFLVISAMILFPLLSSYLALQFTGASTYTSLSGVKKELRIAFPVYIAGSVLTLIFLILYKISDWGMI